MERMGTRLPVTGRRSVRGYTFAALLLLAVVAPAGMVLATEARQPYIVVFADDAISSTEWLVAASGASEPFLVQAMPATLRASRQRPDDTDSRERSVDPQRVLGHVRDIAFRNRVAVDRIFSNAVGGFSAYLTAAQLRAVGSDPAVGAIVADEPIELDEGAAGRNAGRVRATTNSGGQVPAGVRRVGARQEPVMGITGSSSFVNADVAILDTGVQRDHPDLNVVGGYNCTSRNRDRWDDNDGHGTHVAGIVGALDNRIGVVGVAPGVRLWSVKVLDGNGRGFLSWMVCGVDWVTAQRQRGAPSRPLIEVANMSISFSGADDQDCGGRRGDPLHHAICRSVARGTTYVVAAGNESHNARRNRPAAYDEVITVSAMADYDGRGGGRGQPSDSCPYSSGERDDAFASFSNYGPDVDLIAPGKCVLSTFTRGRYAWMSGTSMAAPHVTGAAVIYRTMFPRATPLQVRLALQAVGTLDWRTTTDPDRDTHERAVWLGQFGQVPDFTLRASRPSGAVTAGHRFTIPISVTRVGGFDEPISVGLSDPPPGFSAAAIVMSDTPGQLTVKVRTRAAAGDHALTVSARSGDLVRAIIVHVTVGSEPPGALLASPTDEW